MKFIVKSYVDPDGVRTEILAVNGVVSTFFQVELNVAVTPEVPDEGETLEPTCAGVVGSTATLLNRLGV
jgi:hypothetical protein